MMLIINDALELEQARALPLPDPVRHVLNLRSDLIGLATFVVVFPDDGVAETEAAAGIPIVMNWIDGSRYGEPDWMPSFEWVLDHGGVFELPFILSDDGSGVVLIVPDAEGIDPILLAIAREHAEPAPDSATAHSKV